MATNEATRVEQFYLNGSYGGNENEVTDAFLAEAQRRGFRTTRQVVNGCVCGRIFCPRPDYYSIETLILDGRTVSAAEFGGTR